MDGVHVLKEFLFAQKLCSILGGPLVITSITAGAATDYLGPKTKDDMQLLDLIYFVFFIAGVRFS